MLTNSDKIAHVTPLSTFPKQYYLNVVLQKKKEKLWHAVWLR